MADSYYKRGGDIALLEQTIPQHFASIAARFGNQQAVVSIPQKQALNYAELAEQIDKVAKGLIGLGFNKGDRIAIWSTNNLQWILVQMATARIGAILVNINPAYRIQELEYALKQAEVQCLITIPQFKNSHYLEMLLDLIPELQQADYSEIHSHKLPFLRRIIVYNPLQPDKSQTPYPGLNNWSDLMSAGEAISQTQLEDINRQLQPEDAINIQYTSGTTGFPKAVILSHYNILNNAWFGARAMHFTEQDRLCIPVPFYHCFGIVLANLLCFSVGACAVIPCEHFSAQKVLQAIEQEQCTAVHGVPTMFIAELEQEDFAHYKLDSLRTGIMAGAPCPPSLMKKVMQEMHCREILIGYGQTEASPLTHLTQREDSLSRRTETVGHNLPHQEVKIIQPETGETVTIGETGEICFRGYHIMKGYYKNPAATEKTIDDEGWLHSGDLGIMDKDGYVSITGRLKDMVIRGGENIYPREIEDFIFNHPKVSAVAVFGVKDDYYGEELAAWIQLHKGETSDEAEIRAFCQNKLSHFKIPKYIRFVDQFPMTVTGKLQKFKMREEMNDLLTKHVL